VGGIEEHTAQIRLVHRMKQRIEREAKEAAAEQDAGE